jgi:hypothetical protein
MTDTMTSQNIDLSSWDTLYTMNGRMAMDDALVSIWKEAVDVRLEVISQKSPLWTEVNHRKHQSG